MIDGTPGDLAWQKCEAELTPARSTISEQEKRIAELEAGDADRQHYLFHLEGSYTSERQRREEADAIVRIMTERPLPLTRTMEAANAAKAHFRKYEPIPADREGERGGK